MLKKKGGVDFFICAKSCARIKNIGCYFPAPFCAVNFLLQNYMQMYGEKFFISPNPLNPFNFLVHGDVVSVDKNP